eukprot:CAMPEP_0176348722 /NCGR_PEP_ID=MMETSP0126-20121128/8097_1 /TAXON_ID=141414 ORGANISM="Strombidinopsis acuminatum, Strain SPMC142" /NCGR_SAMPLE_ID=MMETSP0126 /ASSEMBLY_ACC=CAM_ASM_000229 /LENGTH=140 /DNA_ID=CAMNT_0017697693 /DNA_START=284 /DNA_END=706 /DNA_ORIENTATION=+
MKSYENKGFDLELRNNITSDHRITDLRKAGRAGGCTIIILVLIGIFAFTSQGCDTGYFIFDNECRACNVWVDELCLECTSTTECSLCEDGYYADDGQCFDCVETYDSTAIRCTKDEILECKEEYFVDNGACVNCDTLVGC